MTAASESKDAAVRNCLEPGQVPGPGPALRAALYSGGMTMLDRISRLWALIGLSSGASTHDRLTRVGLALVGAILTLASILSFQEDSPMWGVGFGLVGLPTLLAVFLYYLRPRG